MQMNLWYSIDKQIENMICWNETICNVKTKENKSAELKKRNKNKRNNKRKVCVVSFLPEKFQKYM